MSVVSEYTNQTDDRRSDPIRTPSVHWQMIANSYHCRVYLEEDTEEGGFTIVAASLPGAISEGESVGEAMENFKEAFRGLLEMYAEAGEAVPWEEVERPSNSIERVVLVDV